MSLGYFCVAIFSINTIKAAKTCDLKRHGTCSLSSDCTFLSGSSPLPKQPRAFTQCSVTAPVIKLGPAEDDGKCVPVTAYKLKQQSQRTH